MEATRQSPVMAELRIYAVRERLRVLLKMRAVDEGTTLNALVIELLEKAMKDWKPKT